MKACARFGSVLRVYKQMKKLIEKYNNKESLLVITSYPPKGTLYGKKVGGVASFAKNNLLPLSAQKKVVVLAEILGKPEIYEEGNILVCRCWKRNFPRIYLDLLKAVQLFSKINQFEVQFEFALYGDLVITGFMPFFLGLLKFFGKEIVIVVHQVLLNLDSLSGHLGWNKNNLKQKIFSLILPFYYYLLSFSSGKIVVLEPSFKRRLEEIGINPGKVFVIRLGVDRSISAMNLQTAKGKLGIEKDELVILSFGFLTWYKGSDLLVQSFNQLSQKYPGKKMKLILAGGESITQKYKDHYQKYIKRLYEQAKLNSKIEITGFVPEEKLQLYFGAADLVVLPYRTFMSSSGVLSLTLSFGKPFIVSEVLNGWFEGMEEGLKLPGLMFFKPEEVALMNTMKKIVLDKSKLAVLSGISKKLSTERDYRAIGLQYLSLWKSAKQIIPAGQMEFATSR